jgi:hypothetical protein
LSTSQEYLLPFPLKTGVGHCEDLCVSTLDSTREAVASACLPLAHIWNDDNGNIEPLSAVRLPLSDVISDGLSCDVGTSNAFDASDFDDSYDCGFKALRCEEDEEEQVECLMLLSPSPSVAPLLERRRPLFEDILRSKKSPVLSNSQPIISSLLFPSAKRLPPSQRFVAVDPEGTSHQCSVVNKYSRASSWPVLSVLHDWRVTSGSLFHRYVDTHDLQTRVPWLAFKDTYDTFFDLYNVYSGGGAYCQRVVIHAHHFPNENGRISATPFQFGEGMPAIHIELIATHFLRAVECTGMNLSLLAVPKWHMCLFDAAASCLYAMRPHCVHPLSKRDKSYIHLQPTSCRPFTLLRKCIVWLLEDRNVLKRMNMTVTGNNNHLNITDTTILNLLCEGLVAGDPAGATLSLGRYSTEKQRLLMYKKYIEKLVKCDEYELILFAEKFLPKLNSVFTQVLCELYCETSVTVVDFVLRAVRTYTSSSSDKTTVVQNFFLYKVAMPNEYYYGLIDNERIDVRSGFEVG